jgi:hypothetical protein
VANNFQMERGRCAKRSNHRLPLKV